MSARDDYDAAEHAYDHALEHFFATVAEAVYTLHCRLGLADLPMPSYEQWADDLTLATHHLTDNAETALDALRDAADREDNPGDYL